MGDRSKPPRDAAPRPGASVTKRSSWMLTAQTQNHLSAHSGFTFGSQNPGHPDVRAGGRRATMKHPDLGHC